MNTTNTDNERLIAYKVLYREPSTDKLVSSNWGPVYNANFYKKLGLVLEYKQEELIVPVIPNSKLFVFKDIKDALQCTGPSLKQLWKVSVDSLEPAIDADRHVYVEPENNDPLPIAWAQDGKWIINLSSLLYNSYLCNNVRLIERID